MKKTVSVILVITALLCAFSLSSCDNAEDKKDETAKETEDTREALSLTDSEAAAILEPLIESAYEINEIFFGRGLAYDGEADTEKTTVSSQYFPVTADCGYTDISQIKEKAESVYSEKYLSSVYTMMFEGYTVDESEEDYAGTVLNPRYKMIDGILKIDACQEGYELKTNPIASSARVVDSTPDYVRVSLDYTVEGGKDGTMTVTLSKNGNGEWRLDSPTY